MPYIAPRPHARARPCSHPTTAAPFPSTAATAAAPHTYCPPGCPCCSALTTTWLAAPSFSHSDVRSAFML